MKDNRTKIAERAGLVGIFCNLLLFLFKLGVGMLANSVSVIADAFNNLTDAGSSVISLIGSRMAGKAADEDHPFGHGRIEYIAAFIVAFLVIQVGFSVFRESLGKILQPQALHFSPVALVVLLASVGVKCWMSFYYRGVARRIDSSVYAAAASDSLGDVLTTGAAVLSLLVYGVFQRNIDGIVGLAVSLIVMYNGFTIAKETLEPLIGKSIDPALYYRIKEFVESYEGILGTHDLIVHNYGPDQYMASIHAEVPGEQDIQISHEVVDQIERDVRRELGIFLVIHMDPVDICDETTGEYRRLVEGLVADLDPALQFHDFRVVHGETHTNLVFDLVTPWDYSEVQQNGLMLQICAKVKERDPRLSCVITVEQSYMHEHPQEKG